MATPVPAVPRSRKVELAASAVYGTILAASTVSVVSEKLYDDPVELSYKVVATLVVFWLAHAFALGMAESAVPGAVDPEGLRERVLSTSPMVLAAIPLLVPLFLSDAGLFSVDAGLWISYAEAVVILAGWGYLIGRTRQLGTAATVRLVVASGALGLLLITLKEVFH